MDEFPDEVRALTIQLLQKSPTSELCCFGTNTSTHKPLGDTSDQKHNNDGTHKIKMHQQGGRKIQ